MYAGAWDGETPPWHNNGKRGKSLVQIDIFKIWKENSGFILLGQESKQLSTNTIR
jgi:hypothetical protein